MICEQLHCQGTMGKQHDQTWLLEPFMLSRRDELIRHDLQGNGDALSYAPTVTGTYTSYTISFNSI